MSAPLHWERSPFCQATACVEVAVEYGHILVRNSSIPLEVIRFSPQEWEAFVAGIRSGGFNYSGSVDPG